MTLVAPPSPAPTTADTELAAAQKAVDDLDQPTTATTVATPTPAGWWSTQDAMTMSAAVLVFGAAVIAIASLAHRGRPSAEEALRLYGTIMVVTMAVFLVVAGYDDKQIAASLGLLGTIAGYLLGRSTKASPPEP